jgi:hypothetical protein
MSDAGATFRPCCPPVYEASGKREADYYPTPAWCVEVQAWLCTECGALLDAVRGGEC